jgi:hypothetical protein
VSEQPQPQANDEPKRGGHLLISANAPLLISASLLTIQLFDSLRFWKRNCTH